MMSGDNGNKKPAPPLSDKQIKERLKPIREKYIKQIDKIKKKQPPPPPKKPG